MDCKFKKVVVFGYFEACWWYYMPRVDGGLGRRKEGEGVVTVNTADESTK